MSVALAMIVRDAAATIERTLASVRPHVDYACVWIDDRTCDGTIDRLERASGKNGAPLTFRLGTFEWFAQARNDSFEMVPEDVDWIIWLDDDELVHGENLRRLVAEAASVGAHWLDVDYDYADMADGRREIVSRSRVVRRGAAEWIGAIHEDLHPLPHDVVPITAQVSPADLLVRHLRRGQRLHGHYLDEMVAATSDLDRTPSAFLHLGGELILLGRAGEAAEALERYLEERHDLLVFPKHNWARLHALEQLARARELLGDPASAMRLRATAAQERATADAYIEALRRNRHATNQYRGVGRNDPCPCGSGKKFKRCHGA